MKSRGFSLIELIVAIAIVSLISLVLIGFYTKSQSIFSVEKSKSALQTVTKTALDEISDDIKKSSSVLSTYTAPNNTVYQTSSTSLVLKIPSIDGAQNVIGNKYDYYIYKIDTANAKNLMRIIYTDVVSARNDSSRVIDQKLSSLNFDLFNATNVEISSGYDAAEYITTTIISQEVVSGKTNTVELNTKSKIRNK